MSPELVKGFLDLPGFPSDLRALVHDGTSGAVDWMPPDGTILRMTAAYRDADVPIEDGSGAEDVMEFFTQVLLKGNQSERWATTRMIMAGPDDFADSWTDLLVERKLLRGVRRWAGALRWAPKLSPHIVDALASVGDPQTLWSLGYNPVCTGVPVEVLADDILDWHRGGFTDWKTTSRNFPGHPNLDVERFQRFVDSGDMFSPGVALSHHASPLLLDDLSRSNDPLTRLNVALNPRTPRPTLVALADRGPSKAQVAARERREVAEAFGWGADGDYAKWLAESGEYKGTATRLAARLGAAAGA